MEGREEDSGGEGGGEWRGGRRRVEGREEDRGGEEGGE